MSERQELFEKALRKCNELLNQYPDHGALLSIARQIEYLHSLETGANPDRSRLKEIIIGVLTAREIEPLDEKAAELFYKVSGEARRM
jgi:hypothetical protein